MVSMFMSLKTNDTEHLSLGPLAAPCVSALQKRRFKSFVYFSIGLVVFLFHTLHIRDPSFCGAPPAWLAVACRGKGRRSEAGLGGIPPPRAFGQAASTLCASVSSSVQWGHDPLPPTWALKMGGDVREMFIPAPSMGTSLRDGNA